MNALTLSGKENFVVIIFQLKLKKFFGNTEKQNKISLFSLQSRCQWLFSYVKIIFVLKVYEFRRKRRAIFYIHTLHIYIHRIKLKIRYPFNILTFVVTFLFPFCLTLIWIFHLTLVHLTLVSPFFYKWLNCCYTFYLLLLPAAVL